MPCSLISHNEYIKSVHSVIVICGSYARSVVTYFPRFQEAMLTQVLFLVLKMSNLTHRGSLVNFSVFNHFCFSLILEMFPRYLKSTVGSFRPTCIQIQLQKQSKGMNDMFFPELC